MKWGFVLVTFIVTAAMAQSAVPSFDVSARCQGEVEELSCVQSQYAGRRMATDLWPSATDAARIECSQAAGRFNDYGTLWLCLKSYAPGGR